MKRPFNKKRFWQVIFILAIVEAIAFCVVLQWKYIFPSKEVSDLYTRYENVDGLDVSYIKDYKINDTVFVGVTILEASDKCVWEKLCEDIHIPSITKIPDEYKDMFLSEKTVEFKVEKDSSSDGGKDSCLEYLYVYSRKDMTICVFHSLTEERCAAIIDKEIDNISY